MDLTVTGPWAFATDNYDLAFAPTNDPRVVAVIKRAEEYGGGHIDGDAYAPAFYYDRQRLTTAGETFQDAESLHIAERYFEARAYFVNRHYRHGGPQMAYDTVADRYLRIFHDSTVAEARSTIEQGYSVHVFNTPTWRHHVGGAELGPVDMEDWQAAIDGDVFAIGYAVYADRVTDEEPIDVMDGNWDITLTCHGMLGEQYAQEEAASFPDETPTLPELLTFA